MKSRQDACGPHAECVRSIEKLANRAAASRGRNRGIKLRASFSRD